MKELKIDVPKGIANVLEGQINQAAANAVNATLQVAKSRWESEVQQKLTTTRADYLLGLNADNSMTFPDPLTGVLTLRGTFPNMLEEGYPSFDMKTGFQKSRRAKPKKDGGWFMTIPFRHRTPGTSGSGAGGAAQPKDIYAESRKLASNGARLRGTEKDYPPRNSWTGYQHKNGIYEGMRKNTKQYEKAIQNTYTTFRRVSDKSDPSSWMHPGFTGIDVGTGIAKWAERTFPKVYEAEIKKAMG